MPAAQHRARLLAAIPSTAAVRRRLELERHARAMAQAKAAGLTGVRDAYTANA